MKLKRKVALTCGLLVSFIVAFASLLALQAQAASAGQLYLTTASTTVQQGSTVSLAVRLTPGVAVNTVTATVSFDSSKLSYQGVSYGGSPFTTPLPSTINSGSITIGGVRLGDTVTSDALVGNVTFIARAGSGSTTVGLTGNAANQGAYTNPAVVGTTLKFTQPPKTSKPVKHCPSGQTGTPPNCKVKSAPIVSVSTDDSSASTSTSSTSGSSKSSKKSSSSPTTLSAAVMQPELIDTDVQYSLASLTIKTKAATRLYVRYGTSKDALSTHTDLTAAKTKHQVTFDANTLLPGQTYYYQAITADSGGHTVAGPVRSMTTKGLTVTIGVFDQNHQPLRNQEVTIHSKANTRKTNQNGFVTFTDVVPGKHTLSYQQDGKNYSQSLLVANNVETDSGHQSAKAQSFAVVYGFTQPSSWLSQTVIGLIVLIIVVIIAVLVIRHGRRGQFGGPSPLAYSPITANGQTFVPAGNDASHKEDASLDDRLSNIPTPAAMTPGTVVTSQEPTQDDNRGEY